MMRYTNKEIANKYNEAAQYIAGVIGKLKEYKVSFDYISNQTMDNADPVCDTAECLENLGCLLASCVIYSNEYLEEGNKENES